MNNNVDKYRYLFFKKIYNELKLDAVENQMAVDGIIPLDIQGNEDYDVISKYFFLLNEINIDRLNKEQLEQFNHLFSKKVKDLNDKELNECYKFIDDTYKGLIFPNVDSKFVYYGPINYKYACPTDAIALGLCYDAFDGSQDFETENKLVDVANYIQFELSKKINNKVVAIRFNELTLAEKKTNNYRR